VTFLSPGPTRWEWTLRSDQNARICSTPAQEFSSGASGGNHSSGESTSVPFATEQIRLYRGGGGPHGGGQSKSTNHGQSEKETSTEDEQAQAPKALEGESPQEAHVAEVSEYDRS
jgi:hypothetical protein